MATWGGFAREASRALGLRAQVSGAALRSLRAPGSGAASKTTTRSFAAGGGKGETFEGLTVHEASTWHKVLAQGFGGVMWFWILYRFRHDYETFLFGHAEHFEHELAHEKEGGSHH
eukprot:CAMPEP_0197490498 /NCGR_PEP_ID=MMETSP1311-20131121/5034_1 /TAXON_ID=464262 /ORGANISM="Genus nov. species nov., Strain RCC856" /LENGTH=115 /DNA_ID=CAMNT_0043035025 /DNA_START=38 /DNA_END=385 /DNA_ORIENTATION=+